MRRYLCAWFADRSPPNERSKRQLESLAYEFQRYSPFVNVESESLILDIDGEERSIWLLNEALFNQFRQEIQSRPERKLASGERVVVQRLGKRKSESTGREYVDFRVHFPDRPEPTLEQLWGDDIAADKATDQQAADEGKTDDGIPF